MEDPKRNLSDKTVSYRFRKMDIGLYLRKTGKNIKKK